MKFGVILGQKAGFIDHHTCTIIALLPSRELDMSHGSVQYHSYIIISNERPFLRCYSLKNEIWGHLGSKGEWGSVQTKYSYFSMLIVPKCYNASFKSTHMIFVVF